MPCCRKRGWDDTNIGVTKSAKILVVEDDPNMLSALGSVLQSQGYEVVTANCAEDAVALSAAQQFDLIVTDIRMGEVDGLQALEKARQVQPEVGALVVSGYASEEETLRAVQLNVGGYLKKPFKMRDFLDQVQQILERRRVEATQPRFVDDVEADERMDRPAVEGHLERERFEQVVALVFAVEQAAMEPTTITEQAA